MNPRAANRLRLFLVLTSLAIPVAASANGAMGLALELFEFRIWTVYVIATIALEAWLIGRHLGHSWTKSIVLSTCLNAVTAFCCAGGLFAPFLHFGAVDANPLVYIFVILSVFGLLSSWVEALLWHIFKRRDSEDWPPFRRSMLAHAVGVPLALVILLLPPRPYKGFEVMAQGARIFALESQLPHLYDGRIDKTGHVRQFRSVQEVEQALDALGGYGACLYPPCYPRFAMHDPRLNRRPVDINPDPSSDDSAWLLRVHEPYGILELESLDSTLHVDHIYQ